MVWKSSQEAAMGREYERKYRAGTDVLQALAEQYAPMERISMETTYFDTPSGALHRRKWMLRLRKENGTSVCTLKIPLPDGSRGEWETDGACLSAAIQTLLAQGCPPALAHFAEEGLIPQCAARFVRLTKRLAMGSSTVELALDQGQLLAGIRCLPISEVEIELKTGQDADCTAFAEHLASQFQLTPEPQSKAQRAFSLIDPRDPRKNPWG